MWNFQRIICIWICCVSCMFGTTQLSSQVQAVPYEYFDDHEQSFYDLDTEQIQAKYDTRLLSQQMLQTEQQQQLQLENLKGFRNTNNEGGEDDAIRNKLENRKQNGDGSLQISTVTTMKLKTNDGQTLDVDDGNSDDERKDWLEETATKAAASTSAITETLDELYLPRAASCYTNGQKYTHGQKVPRLDNCEVCLCMDGEIFCWWEKCDKKPPKAFTTYDDYATPFEESSTTRMQINPKTTYKTTLKPIKKPKTNDDYKYDDDDSAEIREVQLEYEGLKEQLMQKEHEQEQHQIHHNKQMFKKKIYQQQEEEKHNKKIKEQNKKNQEEQQQRYNKQQYKTSEHFEQHHRAHNHNSNNKNNRNHNHDYGSSGSSSKILNFPENLPSVLYYDYKTEEHHQHQHQHREQHLKHQKQKQQQKQLLLQQHEKELKHRHQQQQKQQKQQHHVNRHHEYGQDFNTYSSSSSSRTSDKTVAVVGGKITGGSSAGDISGGPSTTFKYFSNGNENIYNGDSQTDSDILPEPPTKKPKFSTSITDPTASEKTTGFPISQFYRLSTSMMATTAGAVTTSTTALKNTPPTASVPLKKEIFSPWDFNKPNTDKISNTNSNNAKNNNNNNESTEDIIDTDDQDDAFHRWLTSTETNNKNNFTLNDGIIRRDDFGGLVAGGGSGGLDASNGDYNLEDRNYENIDLETEMGLSTAKTKTKATIKPVTTMGAVLTTLNAFDINGEGEVAVIDGDRETNKMYENSQKPQYEQIFSGNNSYNNNNSGNNMGNSNGIINSNTNNNNISPFSSHSYEIYNRNNNNISSSISSGESTGSSTTSNEDNGVASVVNIDIMLTASSADLQQPQQTNIETANQQRQLQDFKNGKQLKFIQPPVLISNTNDVVNNNPLYSIINDNTKNYNSSNNDNNSSSSSNKTIKNIVGDGLNIEKRTQLQLQNVGVNMSSTSNKSNNTNNNHSLSSSSDSFSFSHISTVVSQTNATSTAGASAATPPLLSTTSTPERQCNVMGTLYKIGDVLPQDTGNCLQCICIDGSTSDDTPRVTCSPHNCPPLVLPDLFDATGY